MKNMRANYEMIQIPSESILIKEEIGKRLFQIQNDSVVRSINLLLQCFVNLNIYMIILFLKKNNIS